MLIPSLQFTGERYPAAPHSLRECAHNHVAPRTVDDQVTAAVALDQLWPGCARGRRPVSTCWIARNNAGRDYVLQVRSAKGPTREFPIGDVPECLWPSEVRNTNAL